MDHEGLVRYPAALGADVCIGLLGSIRATFLGRHVEMGSRPTEALLALLVLRRRAWSRDDLVAQIWPDAAFSASNRLRQALWLLRKGFAAAGTDPSDLLVIDDRTIGLRPRVPIDVDVARFEESLRHRPPDLEAALALYRGDLAEGLAFECLAARREYLANQYENALAQTAWRRLAVGDVRGAGAAAVELLGRDPLREDAHAVLMRVYGVTGSRSQVHRHYRSLRSLLATQLEAEPLAETHAAYLDAMGLASAPAVDRQSHAIGPAILEVRSLPGPSEQSQRLHADPSPSAIPG